MSRRKRKNLTHAEVEVDGAEPPVEPAAAAPSDEPTTRVETEEIERLRAEASEMRDLAQRKQAEFENYRKRMERERLDLSRYAEADVVKEVLPVLDNLERALRDPTVDREGFLDVRADVLDAAELLTHRAAPHPAPPAASRRRRPRSAPPRRRRYAPVPNRTRRAPRRG